MSNKSEKIWGYYSYISLNMSDAFKTAYINYQMMKHDLTVKEVLEKESDELIKGHLSGFINSDKEKISNLDKDYINVRNEFKLKDLEEALCNVDSSVYGRKDIGYTLFTESLLELAMALSGEVIDKTFANFYSVNGNSLYKYAKVGARELTSIYNNEDESFILHVVNKIIKEKFTNKEVNIFCENIFDYSLKNPSDKYNLIVSDFPWGVKFPKESIARKWNSKLFDNNLDDRTSSDWKFISVVMAHLSENGKGFVLAPSAIEYKSIDNQIRNFFIENGFIEKVIHLPENMLNGTSLSSYLLVLSYNNDKIQFIDASNVYSEKGRKRYLSEKDIEEIILKTNDSSTYEKTEKVLESGRLNPAFYNIPNLKESIKLSEVATVKRGTQFKSKELAPHIIEKKTNIELIRMRHLKYGQIVGSDSLTKLPENYTELKNEDIIMTRVGSNMDLTIFHSTEEIKSIIDESLYIIRCDKNKINPYYLLAFLQSPLGKEYLSANYKGGIISRISIRDLKDLDIPQLSHGEEENISNQIKIIDEDINKFRIKTEILKAEKNERLNLWFKGAVANG